MDKWEAKQAYVERVMSENRKADTLTEEQHDFLSRLAQERHNLHVSWDDVWTSRASFDFLFDDMGSDYAPLIARELDLPELKISECVSDWSIPSEDDYYELLDSDERDEWERLADEYNDTKPEGAMYQTGASMWREESGEYEYFAERLTAVNNEIENYLRAIDEQYGTHYAPTGVARLR